MIEVRLNSLSKQKFLDKVWKIKFNFVMRHQWECSLVLLGAIFGYLLGKFQCTSTVNRNLILPITKWNLPNWVSDGPSALSREFIKGILNSLIQVLSENTCQMNISIIFARLRIECCPTKNFNVWNNFLSLGTILNSRTIIACLHCIATARDNT